MNRAAMTEQIVSWLSTRKNYCLEDLCQTTLYGRPEKIEEIFLDEFKLSNAALEFLTLGINAQSETEMSSYEEKLNWLKSNPTDPSELSHPLFICDVEVNGKGSGVTTEMEKFANMITQDEINSIRRFFLQHLSWNDWDKVLTEFSKHVVMNFN